MATYTVEPYERGGQTLTGYAAEYARALDAGASNSQAHQQANYQAGGTGITAAEMDKYGQTGYTVNPNTGYVASQYDAQSDAWRAEDSRREAERQRQLELERLKQAQIAANMAQLDKSKAASLSAIAQEQSAVDPRFYEAKRQTQEQSALARRQAEEYAAAKGLSSSGLAAQSQSTISGGLQSALGSLGQSQAEAHAQIERAKSDLEAAYQSDVAGVQAGAEAQYLQNVIDQYYKDREYQLAKEQLEQNKLIQQMQLFGKDPNTGELTLQGQQALQQGKLFEFQLQMAEKELGYSDDKMRLEIADMQNRVNMGALSYQEAEMRMELMPYYIENEKLMMELDRKYAEPERVAGLQQINAQIMSAFRSNQPVAPTYLEQIKEQAEIMKYENQIAEYQAKASGVSYDPKEIEIELKNLNPVHRQYVLEAYGDPGNYNGKYFEGYKNILNMPKYNELLDYAIREARDMQIKTGSQTVPNRYMTTEKDPLGQLWPDEYLKSGGFMGTLGR